MKIDNLTIPFEKIGVTNINEINYLLRNINIKDATVQTDLGDK